MDPTKIPTEEELDALLNRTFTSRVRAKYISVNGCLLPERYLDLKEDIDNFEVKDSDVWICGFPKTGTTWASEIAWQIVHNFDFEGGREPDYRRTRQLEFSMLCNSKEEVIFHERTEEDSVGYCREQESPRTLKTHLPFSLLPKQIINDEKRPKIIYTARNAMDTCISDYYQCKNYEKYVGTLEEFCDLFLFNKVNYGPYPTHVLSFWEQRNRPNILFLTYEEMQKDIVGTIKKIAQLLDSELSDEQITTLREYVSFDSMKKNPGVNKEQINDFLQKTGAMKEASPFMRKGKAGGYKTVMTEDRIAQFRLSMGKELAGAGLNLLD